MNDFAPLLPLLVPSFSSKGNLFLTTKDGKCVSDNCITFLDYQEYFNIKIEKPTLIIGCISIFLLAFTLIKQGVGHKQLYEKHQLAGKMYAQAKGLMIMRPYIHRNME